MANTINYATAYEQYLDQMIQQASMTSVLETPSVNWMGAKSFVVPHLNVSGYQPHTRDKGYNQGTVSNENNIYTLGFDRDVEFFVDIADVDESNQAASVANITRVFSTEHAVPEMDAYRFSKLAQYASTVGQSQDEAITTANAFQNLKAAIKEIRKYGPQNIIGYVSTECMNALEQSTAFTRQIYVMNQGTAIETRVTQLDGVQLVEIWDSARFYDSYDFTNGFVPANTGGATPTVTAKQLNYLLVVKNAVVAKAKFNSIFLFAPGQHTEGDGWLYQNRIYHDLFMLKYKQNGVVASTIATA